MNNIKNGLLVFIALLLAGCGGWGDIPTTVELNSITVVPASLTVTNGLTAPLSAIGIYTDGSTADITSQVTWESAAPATAAVGNNGIVAGAVVGTTVVTAKLKGITSSATNVTVTAATLSSIAITPASTTIAVGVNANLSAIGTYSDGTTANLTTQVNWSSIAPATASIGVHTGVVLAVAVGTTSISASLNGSTSPSASITVTPEILTSIAITPTNAVIFRGGNQTFTATGTYSNGSTGNISGAVTWNSSNTAVATVSTSGIATGLSVNTTNISASLSGITSNSATLNVSNTAPVANAGSARSVWTGTVVTLNGSASSDANGDTLTYNWTLTTKPAGSVATLTSAATTAPTFTADLAGSYIVTLVVNDGLANSTAATVTITAYAPQLNDTGITYGQCYQAASDVLVTCNNGGATTLNPAQDGMVGRDANPSINSNNADGRLGFSFAPVAGGCVQDNVTGLMWEVKTADGGLRDMNNTYTNYSAAYNPSNLYGTDTDVSGYLNAVNAAALCGFNDWRLPNTDELQSIVDYGVGSSGPSIDATRFPNTPSSVSFGYWTASPYFGNTNIVWAVDFHWGASYNVNRLGSNYVRLVRTGLSKILPRYTVSVDGQEVTDNQTKLIWRRCVEGMIFSGGTCTGTATGYAYHEDALQHAAAQAGITGWRLPNVKELFSITDNNYRNPAIDPAVFPATPVAQFWTASPFVGDSTGAWSIQFSGGSIFHNLRSYGGYVRLVRTGQ